MPTATLADARAMAVNLRQNADASEYGAAAVWMEEAADALDLFAGVLLTCATRLAAEFGRAGDGEALADRLLGEAGRGGA